MGSSAFDAAFARMTVAPGLDKLGENIAYTPSGGTVKTIKAIVETPTLLEDSSAARECHELFCSIAADDTNGVAAPKEIASGQTADTFTWDGRTWVVVSVDSRNQGGWHRLRARTKWLRPNN